ncbi:MAG: hypothetical protein CMJ64_22990 [Planctomycetaceae bacterium]|nr:hypothetical protein [Planctomycetaceae bacterium]
MAEQQFEYDAFLSYSSKDKPAVQDLAERLKGWLRVIPKDEDEVGRIKAEAGLHLSSLTAYPGRSRMASPARLRDSMLLTMRFW